MSAVETSDASGGNGWGDWRLGDLDVVLSRATEILGGWCEVLSVAVMGPAFGLTCPRLVVHLASRAQAEELVDWIAADERVVSVDTSCLWGGWDVEMDGYDVRIIFDENGDAS